MTNLPNTNELNLTEFDLESYEIAQDLGLGDEAFEIAVEVAKQDDCEFIPLDDFDLSQ